MPTDNPERDSIWMFGLSFIGSPSSELFLALSGTCLIPVRVGFRKFYKRRFLKLLPPLFIWSILGVTLYTVIYKHPWHDAINEIIRIPLQPAVGVYWFVYAMAGLYLLAPFISPWLKQASKKQIELFLCLWSINMSFPWIMHFVPNLTSSFILDGNYYWSLCYFGGFIGYWIMGYYLENHPIKIGINIRCITLFSGVVAYPFAIFIIKINNGDVSPLLDNLQIGSVFLVGGLYTIMQNIRVRPYLQRILTHIAKYSFGIYLTHIYIARELYWNIFYKGTIHTFPRTFIIALLTLLTGYLLTYLISRIPKSKYIIGV